MRRSLAVSAALAAIALGPVACVTGLGGPDLGGLYNRAAREHGARRNPIVVIPGVLGSRLRDAPSNRVVWGSFAGNYANPLRADGASLLALPMAEGATLSDLRDDVVPDGVLDRVRVSLLRLPLELKAYFHLLGALGAGGYRDEELGRAGAIDYGGEHFTCFQFAYDWRRDIPENARRLGEFLAERRAYVQAEYARRYGISDHDVRFDVVAHSMGGLVLRYFLRFGGDALADGSPLPAPTWAGARDVERAIFVGTPNAGSLDALETLVEGKSFSWLLPHFPAAVLGSMPSLYQLLPRARHGRLVAQEDGAVLDPLDPEVWETRGWGLVAPDAAPVLERLLPDVPDPGRRRAIARDHLRKSLARARRVQWALDAPASPPPGTALQLIAGDSEPTPAVFSADARGRLRAVAHAPGDGTVLRSSALLDEREGGPWQPGVISPIAWDRVGFIFADHLGMTRDPAFTDNLLFLLLEEPRTRPGTHP